MDNKIKDFRINKRITQQELADAVGITRPYLSLIERNKKMPSAFIAAKIAKVLEAEFEDVFFQEDSFESKDVK